ncbi:DNA-binding protein [Oceanotoga sp. DSM 15011]|uniref:DUF4350 domain-containing protein n=1 Tax=Oceanotoga sp. DSM 15011 TaxID=2984951 RepID=UPI0021F4A48F|nr:DUF4350 domain-containing protein [Oceanotoga sp. DSM 15011]UYP00717.1 DNA-binding protein [Oceanotoga sp. DSM 15011]
MKKSVFLFMVLTFTIFIYAFSNVITIEKARTFKDLTPVTVEGVVTLEPGPFDINLFFIQDDTAGLNVYSGNMDFSKFDIERNDLIRVTGYLWKHKMNLELVLDKDNEKHSIEILEKNYKEIEPINIKTVDINEEKYEGILAHTEGKVIKAMGQEILIDDGTGEGILWIRENTKIDPMNFKEGIDVEVTGVMAQYLTKREIQPRSIEDLKTEDIFPPEIEFYSIDNNILSILFNEEIIDNFKLNKTIRDNKNNIKNYKLINNKILKIEYENLPVDSKLMLRFVQDMNENKANILSIDISEKNIKKHNILFDESHSQTAGNSDWTITGGYSDFADLAKKMGLNVKNEKIHIKKDILDLFGIFIIPEPNGPFFADEIEALLEWVKDGGNLFIIADHGGADRNGNGWDAVRVFNEFTENFGFLFEGDDLEEEPLKNVYKHEITKNIQNIGVWNGSSINILKKDIEVLISDINKKPYLISTVYGKGKVIAIGDSSPFDDGTGATGNILHDGWSWGDDAILAENILKYFLK